MAEIKTEWRSYKNLAEAAQDLTKTLENLTETVSAELCDRAEYALDIAKLIQGDIPECDLEEYKISTFMGVNSYYGFKQALEALAKEIAAANDGNKDAAFEAEMLSQALVEAYNMYLQGKASYKSTERANNGRP